MFYLSPTVIRKFCLTLIMPVVLLLGLVLPGLANGLFSERVGLDNPLYLVFPYLALDHDSTPTLVDIDADSDFDLFYGGSFGNVLHYENIGDPQTPIFVSRPNEANPLNGVDVSLDSTPVFVDIDQDQDYDLFIGEGTGRIHYYENIGTSQNPNFVQRTGAENPLDLVSFGADQSIPALVDLDQDNDFDAVIGEWASPNKKIHYYENTGTAQSPTFVERLDSDNPFDGLDGCCGPTLVDIDQDNDLDLLIAGRSFGVYYYENVGTAQSPVFSQRFGSDNPFETLALTPNLLALADLDQDQDFDLLSNDGSLFHNTGTAQNPQFTAVPAYNNPLLGINYSTPTLVDIDADGDFDAFIGSGNPFSSPHPEAGQIIYYENTGSPQNSAFTRRIAGDNPLNGFDAGNLSAPTFIDIDADGDFDAFSGEKNGRIYFYQNTGTAQAPLFVEQTGPANPLEGVNVNSFSAPSFVDIDADGDFDAFIGENFPRNSGDGNIVHYENIGTPQLAQFTLRTGLENPLFGIYDAQRATPAFVDIDQDSDFDVFIGNWGQGNVYHYENIGTAQSALFAVRGSAAPLNVNVGSWSAPTFVDLDQDGDSDAFIGSAEGLVHYYRNEAIPTPVTANTQITAGNGGALTTADGLRLTFPPDAVSTTVTLTYRQLFTPTAALGTGRQVVRSFTLEARTGGGELITTFNQPYTLTLDYTEAALTALGIDETGLNVLYWHGSTWVEMLPCLGCRVNTTANQVIVIADHFTEFALVGEQDRVYLPLLIR